MKTFLKNCLIVSLILTLQLALIPSVRAASKNVSKTIPEVKFTEAAKHFSLICSNRLDNKFFSSDPIVNRAELLKIIFCSDQGLSDNFFKDIKINFKDVKGDEDFIKDLKLAIFLESIKGFPDNTFRPYDEVTIEQALKIIFSIRESVERRLFGDYVSVQTKIIDPNNWADAYITKGKELNLLDNIEQKKGKKIKRSEVLEMLFRLDVIEKTNTISYNSESIKSMDYLTFFVDKKEKNFLEDFVDTLDILKSYYLYPEELEKKEPYQSSIFGFVDALKDDYTNVYEPSKYLDLPILPDQVDLGFTLGSKNIGTEEFYYYVATIDSKSVAYKLGLRKNYVIEQIMIGTLEELNQENSSIVKQASETVGFSPKFINISFRNSIDSQYETEISFPVEVKDSTLVNGRIIGDVLYLRIRIFGGLAFDQFVNLTQSLKKSNLANLKGYVLDLRGNPGGEVDLLMKLAEFFYQKDTTVFKFVDNDKKEHEVKTKNDPANADIWRKDIPWTVLIDGNSASASEVLTNSLIDLKKGTKVIGQPSYGKGKMQVTFGLEKENFILAVTIAELISPHGRHTDKVKINPSVILNPGDNFLMFDKSKDLAIKKALELLKVTNQ